MPTKGGDGAKPGVPVACLVPACLPGGHGDAGAWGDGRPCAVSCCGSAGCPWRLGAWIWSHWDLGVCAGPSLGLSFPSSAQLTGRCSTYPPPPIPHPTWSLGEAWMKTCAQRYWAQRLAGTDGCPPSSICSGGHFFFMPFGQWALVFSLGRDKFPCPESRLFKEEAKNSPCHLPCKLWPNLGTQSWKTWIFFFCGGICLLLKSNICVCVCVCVCVYTYIYIKLHKA